MIRYNSTIFVFSVGKPNLPTVNTYIILVLRFVLQECRGVTCRVSDFD